MDPEIMAFLKICFCCNIMETYGSIESGSLTTLTENKDPTCGHIGLPSPFTELKLVIHRNFEVMKYDGYLGEICIKGLNVVKNYHNGDAASIDSEGWHRTGDIGNWSEDG